MEIEYKKEIDKIFETIFKGNDIEKSKESFFKKTGFSYENINSSMKNVNGFTLEFQINNLTRIFKKAVGKN